MVAISAAAIGTINIGMPMPIPGIGRLTVWATVATTATAATIWNGGSGESAIRKSENATGTPAPPTLTATMVLPVNGSGLKNGNRASSGGIGGGTALSDLRLNSGRLTMLPASVHSNSR